MTCLTYNRLNLYFDLFPIIGFQHFIIPFKALNKKADCTILAKKLTSSIFCFQIKVFLMGVNSTDTNPHSPGEPIPHLANFYVFFYMFVLMLISNMATSILRKYRRSLPLLRINQVLLLNGYLVEIFNTCFTYMVICQELRNRFNHQFKFSHIFILQPDGVNLLYYNP